MLLHYYPRRREEKKAVCPHHYFLFGVFLGKEYVAFSDSTKDNQNKQQNGVLPFGGRQEGRWSHTHGISK
jgi:hypothetical protein